MRDDDLVYMSLGEIMFLTNFLMFAMAQSGAAQAEVVPPGRWTIDYGRQSCTLARRLGDAGSPILAFNAPLGYEPGELLVMDGGTGLDRRLTGELEIRLDEGTPLVIRSRREQRNGRTLVQLAPMPDDFLDRVAEAGRLRVSSGDDEVVSLDLASPRGAIDELARCNEDLLRSWGVDISARRSLSRQPRLGDIGWALQIRPSTETSLVFLTDISERGRPLDCRVVVSSGNERMDRAFCNLVRSRARFRPALSPQGQPVRAQYVTRIRWFDG